MWSFGFGLVHGLAFASALGELGLKGMALLRGLVGFNAGVEIGQLIFVVVALPLLTLTSQGRGAQLTPRLASIAAAVIGTYCCLSEFSWAELAGQWYASRRGEATMQVVKNSLAIQQTTLRLPPARARGFAVAACNRIV